MFNVQHATIDATGKIQIVSFKVTSGKNEQLDSSEKIDRFLRTKMKNKGHHKHWKRYGSWTFTNDDDDQPSLLYAWVASKGTCKHKYCYQLDDGKTHEVYDDLLLMRFPVSMTTMQLNEHLHISADHVKEWLECVLQHSEILTHEISTEIEDTSTKLNKKKKKTQSSALDTGIIPDDNCTSDAEDNDTSVLDVENNDNTTKDENILEDTLDDNDNDNDKVLLLDDDDDDEDDEDDDNCSIDEDADTKLSDDEDTDFESEFDTDVLQYEDYTYTQQNKVVKRPLLLSLWTT